MRSRRLIVSWRVSFTPISTRVTKLPKTSSSNCKRHTTYFQIRRIENSTMSTARTGAPLKPEPEHRRLRDGNVPKVRREDARVDSILTTLISDVSALAAQEASTSSKRCLEAREVVVHVVVAAAMLKLSWKCRSRKRIEADGVRCRCKQRRYVRRVAALV